MSDKRHPSRRELLKLGAAATTPWLVHSSLSAQSDRIAANDRIETAVIGIGERGKYLIANLPPSFRVTALCDCSLDQIDSAKNPPQRFAGLLRRFVEGDLSACRFHQDYRSMLDQQRFDAVIIAAPDHHHALAAILAMQASAHVYVEKPLAVTISEGRAIAEAATRYRRVVQVGSQQRTMQVNRTACEFIRSGGLGKITLVEERNYPGPMPYQEDAFATEKVPSSLNWDLFCGPTPRRSYNKKLWVKDAFAVGNLTWRGWDLFEDYSGHLMTNWGAHSVDMIQYALGKDRTGPVQIELRPDEIDQFIDDQWHEKTPPLGTLADQRIDRARFCPLVMTYADGTEVQFKTGASKTVFHGEKGRMYLSRNDYRTEPAGLLPPPDPSERAKWDGSGHVARPHLQNWLDAMRSGGKLNAPIETGHRSASVCHLANIARRIGKSLRWAPESERFIDDAEANDQLQRPRRRGFELPTV
jgi:predicted dehydrogenase